MEIPYDIRELRGPKVYTADLQVSAQNLGTVMQRGSAALAAGVKFVTFPRAYSGTVALAGFVTSQTSDPSFVTSIVVSGMTVSGSGTNNFFWLSIGYQ